MEKSSFLKIVTILALFFLVGFLKTEKEKVAGIQTSTEEKPIRGIILPHHKLAEDLILESFEKLKGQSYSYVVVLGPNHFQPEVNSVVTAKNTLTHSFESEVMDQFLQKYPDILVSEDITKKEHSITLHLLYIKNYFQAAKIVPLIISPYASKTDLYEKISYLTSTLPPDTLYIASVDFAHNLDYESALTKNEESIKAIFNFDHQTILKFKDDHMDSQLSVFMLLKAMENIDATSWETWESSHSAFIEDDPTIQGTGYVIGVFR